MKPQAPKPTAKVQGEIERLFTAMHAEKGDLVERCRMYAAWTIPALVPPEGGEVSKIVTSYIRNGPRLIHTLSNKIVEAMFPQSRPFFSVGLNTDIENKLRAEVGPEKVAATNVQVNAEARYLERYAMSKMNLIEYRPKAVEAAQMLIVTGNTVIRRLRSGDRAVYGIADFGIRRDISGRAYDIVFKDMMGYEELPDAAKEVAQMKQSKDHTYHADSRTAKYPFYTRVMKVDDAWVQTYEVCGITLTESAVFSEIDRPFIDLVWSLPRGYNYARGLVEEHANTFHNLNTLSEAIIDIGNMLADIKWIVGPTSMLDVNALNSSPRGSYHAGDSKDVAALMADKARELQALTVLQESSELELAKAFLMQNGSVRQAERVTAYEVQLNALELEGAFGGLYSRLALAWQDKEARYLLSTLNLKSISKKLLDIRISTGIENLARETALSAFRAAVSDLQLFDAVPEEIRADMNPSKLATFVFSNRGLDYQDLAYTTAEKQAIQEQQMAMQQQLGAQEVAMKAAVQPSNEGA